MSKQEKDFLKLILAFMVMAVVILVAMPINKKWFIAVIALYGFAWVLQWYWNRNFK